jgi:hypothetical protein
VVGEFAFEMRSPAGVVVKMPCYQWDIRIAALADGLAVVHGFEHGEKAAVLLDHAGDRVEKFPTLITT